MTLTRTLTAAVLAMSSSMALAGDAVNNLSCSDWKDFSQTVKVSYTLGFLAGASWISNGSGNRIPLRNSHLPLGFNTKDVASGIDTLCAPPENSALPINVMMETFSLKANGTPASTIDNLLTALRRGTANQNATPAAAEVQGQ